MLAIPLSANAVKPADTESIITIRISTQAISPPFKIYEATLLCKSDYGDTAFVVTTKQLLDVISRGQEPYNALLVPNVDGSVMRVTELRGADSSTAYDIYSGTKGTYGVTCYGGDGHFKDCNASASYTVVCGY
jgi:hypothetical protein